MDAEFGFPVAGMGPTLNELGLCDTTWRGGEWTMPASTSSEFNMVAGSQYETLTTYTAKLSGGTLAAAASISTHTGKDIINDFITHTGARNIEHIVGHSALTADMGVVAQRSDALGIKFIGGLEKNKVKGIIDSMRIIDKYNISTLQRQSGRKKSLKQEDIFMLATGGKNMKQMGWTAHRALDDAKAERHWLTALPEFSDMFFGAEKVKCSISLPAFRKYHEQYQKHREFKRSLAGP